MSTDFEAEPPPGEVRFTGFAPTLAGDVHIPLPDEHEVYALLGRVAVGVAYFEHILDQIIWDVSGADPELAACLTSPMPGAYQRFIAIKALAAHRLARYHSCNKILNSINGLEAVTRDILKDRHRLIHDAWYIPAAAAALAQFRAKPKDGPSFGFVPYDIENIKTLITHIHQEVKSAEKLHNQIRAALASLS
jgi:hypothetical protein